MSFQTLTELTIDVQHTQSSGTAITNPYGYDWAPALRRLINLKVLRVHISIAGDLDCLLDEGTHAHWGALPSAITLNSDGCPSLREFHLAMRVYVRSGEGLEKGRAAAHSFYEMFTAVTYPVHLLPVMRAVEKEGRGFSFSFKGDIVVGEVVQAFVEDRYGY